MRRVLLLGLAVAVAVGCGGDDGGGDTAAGPTVRSPGELAELVEAAGLGCSDFELTSPSEQDFAVAAQGTCEVLGERADLSTFEDGQLAGWFTMTETAGCSIDSTFGEGDGFEVVVGPSWVLVPESGDTADQVAEELGAGRRSITC